MAKLLCCVMKDLCKQTQLVEMSRRGYALPRPVPVETPPSLPDKPCRQIEIDLVLHTIRQAIVHEPPAPRNLVADSSQTSSLAGNPTSYSCPQNIRAEILDRWESGPTPTFDKDWLRDSIYY